jgi:tRNA-specific 2-thiouridylase
MLDQDALARVRLPIGEMTKAQVRAVASDLGLRTATKPDSQDICFVTSGDYRDFIRSRHPEASEDGDIVDSSGTVLGRHHGTASFTIGQRRGLGVAVGEARYVVDIDPREQVVTIGPYEQLLAEGCLVSDMSFTHEPIDDGDEVTVVMRYRGEGVEATVHAEGDRFRFVFAGAVPKPAPGQALVVYDGDRVVGGGTIVGDRSTVTSTL